MTLIDYEEKFAHILHSELKVLPKRIHTLFDIAGFRHYETVISNFYAYYFDPNGEHGLTDLFLAALHEIIVRKSGQRILNDFGSCIIERERCTSSGKFIDIVIYEVSESNHFDNAIIIENKIYANLYNELTEYYNDVSVSNNKVGVVLSLKKESNLPPTFVNITHAELIIQVEQSIGTYFLNAEAKHLIIFKEFIQNIKTMSVNTTLSDQYDFFFKYEDKIRDLSQLYNAIKADIFTQVNSCCEKLEMGLELKSIYHSSLRFFTSPVAPVKFTIWLADIMDEKHSLGIIVELDEQGMKWLDDINKIEFTEDERKYLHETSKLRKSYLHYAHKWSNPTSSELKNLTEFIYQQITGSPLKSIFIKIEKLLIGKNLQ